MQCQRNGIEVARYGRCLVPYEWLSNGVAELSVTDDKVMVVLGA
jgi:hypothetical protein